MTHENKENQQAPLNERGNVVLDRMEEFLETDVAPLYGRLKSSIRRAEAQRRKKITWMVAAITIPAVLLIAVGRVFLPDYFSGNDASPLTIASGDVILTMFDGSPIVIDQSVLNGRIARQESIDIVRRDGALMLETDSPDAGTEESAPMYSTLVIPKGRTFDIILGDGTHVWLNAESRLRFPVGNKGGERRVYLEGEAYFEVTKDANRPFIVETAAQTLDVLGTKFNISAYPDQVEVYTSLVEGSVSLMSKPDRAETMLQPGQQARLREGGYEIGTFDVSRISSWRNGIFELNERLDRIFVRLSRLYDIEYQFDNAETAALMLMGDLPVDEHIDRTLRVIESSGPISIERKGNTIKIRQKR